MEEHLTCENLKGFSNIGNSCYLDSVIFSLFAIHNDFVDENILFANINNGRKCDSNPEKNNKINYKIQKELFKIAYTHKRKNCKKLRKALRKCPYAGEADFSSTEQQDAGEFLQYILSFFNITQSSTSRIRLTFGTNDLSPQPKWMFFSNGVKYDGSIVQTVPYHYFKHMTNKKFAIPIINFLTLKEDSGKLDKEDRYITRGNKFKRRIEYETVTSSPYLIFYIIRAGYNKKPLRNPIQLNEHITLQSGKILHLSSIVNHTGSSISYGHYTSYIKCKDSWYFYDDISSHIDKIGNFENLIKNEPNPMTEGILYFYT